MSPTTRANCPRAVLALPFMLIALVSQALGQRLDTLRHHPAGLPLALYRYGAAAGSGIGEGAGLLLGHNSHYRQQFAERYTVAKTDRVRGVVVHLGGVYAHGDHLAQFRLYTVAKNGLPDKVITEKAIAYRDLDLSGQAMYIDFDSAIAMPASDLNAGTDSFFVAFDLGDYAHGGYEGDSLGLYACERGCRSDADLALFGRNAVQWHNHDKVDWHDFYYQNFTPLAVHFAIYPVIERNVAPVLYRNSVAAPSQKGWTNPSYRWMDANLFRSRDALGRKR